MMKQYIFKLLWVAVPALIFCVFSSWVLYKGGELKTLDRVVEEMAEARKQGIEKLVGWGYQDNDKAFKLRMSNKLHPDILAVGTSRVMQFREEWFADEYSFYNAGGCVFRLDEVRPFLERLTFTPKVVIFCLDQFFFKEVWGDGRTANYEYNYDFNNIILSNLSKVVSDFVTCKIGFETLIKDTLCIGMNAKMNQNGYRPDGSYYYGAIYAEPCKNSDTDFNQLLSIIDSGTDSRWDYCQVVNNQSLKTLANLITYCQQNSILVLSYLPPFSPKVWNHMEGMGDKYIYMQKLYDEISHIFASYPQAFFFDYSDGGILNSPNPEYIDGFHGSDRTYLKMVIQIVEKYPVLSCYFKDGKCLSDILQNYPVVGVARE